MIGLLLVCYDYTGQQTTNRVIITVTVCKRKQHVYYSILCVYNVCKGVQEWGYSGLSVRSVLIQVRFIVG